MQKALLGRDGNGVAAVEQQDRLPELQVPVAQSELLALERRHREIGALHVGEELRRVRRIRTGRRLAYYSNRAPGLQVERRHEAMEQPTEPALQLNRAPLIERGIPGRGDEARRTRDR